MSGLLLLDALAEARIEAALAAGAFDNLPGAGRPLERDDDRLAKLAFIQTRLEARKR